MGDGDDGARRRSGVMARLERCQARMGTLKSLHEALQEGRSGGSGEGSSQGQAVTLLSLIHI